MELPVLAVYVLLLRGSKASSWSQAPSNCTNNKSRGSLSSARAVGSVARERSATTLPVTPRISRKRRRLGSRMACPSVEVELGGGQQADAYGAPPSGDVGLGRRRGARQRAHAVG